MQKVQVNFGDWIEKGFILYKDNFGTLVLASILVMALSVVTVGILAGPMIAGLSIVILDLLNKKEPKPEAGKVFRGFDYFLNSLLFTVVWGLVIIVGSLILGIIPLIGQLASIFFAYAAQAFLMFGFFLIVDGQMDFQAASRESINTVKTNFWPFFGLSAVAGIIGSIGAVACGIGIVFTIPIQGCILAVAYREVYGKQRAADH
jgi:uncharacterized membrane protein